jgi:hypothetical protein
MLEFRKDIFADERDDNLHEIGQPTQRQDMLGHVTGTSPYYDDHRFGNLLHLKILRSPHATRASARSTIRLPHARRASSGSFAPPTFRSI